MRHHIRRQRSMCRGMPWNNFMPAAVRYCPGRNSRISSNINVWFDCSYNYNSHIHAFMHGDAYAYQGLHDNVMETFSVLLAICAGNSPVSFDVFLDLRVNKRLSKQFWGWRFETLPCSSWRQCNAFYQYGLTFITAWISYYIHHKIWDEITYPFINFNRATVEVWEWISYLIPHFTRHVITYPSWG